MPGPCSLTLVTHPKGQGITKPCTTCALQEVLRQWSYPCSLPGTASAKMWCSTHTGSVPTEAWPLQRTQGPKPMARTAPSRAGRSMDPWCMVCTVPDLTTRRAGKGGSAALLCCHHTVLRWCKDYAMLIRHACRSHRPPWEPCPWGRRHNHEKEHPPPFC